LTSRGPLQDKQSPARAAAQRMEAQGAIRCLLFADVKGAELARQSGDEATHERELRETYRLFTAMGATGHAERLAQEMGA
jgi:hypothetical protein